MRETAEKVNNKHISTRTWIVSILVFFLVCAGGAAALFFSKPGTVANVYRDGKCIYSVDLSAVTAPFEKSFTDENGHTNTIRVEKGRICMTKADCPDKTCVHTGWIDSSALPVVCLPHRLVIRVEKKAESGIDTVAK
jgi:hypothetical protein